MKKLRIQPTYLQKINQDLLTFKPWLWQTKVHYVVAVMGVVNLLVAVSLFLNFHRDPNHVMIVGVMTSMGFCYWLYKINQINLKSKFTQWEEKHQAHRFWAFFSSSLLFIFPNIMLWVARNPSREILMYEFGVHSYPALQLICLFLFVVVAIHVWQIVGSRTFFISFILSVSFVGVMFMMDQSSAWWGEVSTLCLVLLTVLLWDSSRFEYRKVKNLFPNNAERKHPTWFLLGYTCVLLLLPILLSSVLGFCVSLFEPRSLMGFFVQIVLPACIVGSLYFKRLLPHYFLTMATLKSLPKD